MAEKKDKREKLDLEKDVNENVEEQETTEAQAPVEEELVKKSELEKVQAESDDYKRRLYAVTAEYENYRKRMASTASQKYAEGRNDVIEKFFSIGDNVERAIAITQDEKTKQGLELILKAYDKIMQEENVTSFDPKGEEFDATCANAVTALPAEGEEKPGTVKITFAKGYKKGDKILRFAQVAVVKED